MEIKGQIVDIPNRKIYAGIVTIEDGKIQKVHPTEENVPDQYILPGFVDAHIHIESSMLVPSEFAKLAVIHGSVATVSDPHEIANVLGVEGVEYMLDNARQVPFKFNFGAPSCVPATSFETAGANIDSKAVDKLLQNPEIKYLTEMMNYPGVLFNDPEVMAKIASAKKYNKPVDGHAPGLRGEDAKKYAAAGITTDHECFHIDEAREKAELGMHILIREGSAAKNFDTLIDLFPKYAKQLMFCSDDKHPDDLILGHLDQLVVRALAKGKDLFEVLQAACINPVKHYNLDVGLLQEGDPADFIVVKNLSQFNVLKTYIDGKLVAKNGESFVETTQAPILNNFDTNPKTLEQFAVKVDSDQIRVIKAINRELITESFEAATTSKDGNAISNTDTDILKFTVVNRYQNTEPAIAFIQGFGLTEGAIASSVGHDSHNILAVGVSDEAICKAVNLVIANKGGIAVVTNDSEASLALPVAGIMTNVDGHTVGHQYAKLDKMAKETLGSQLTAPFMTLSFMALLVIPSLKLSDKGLFDGNRFEFTPLFI
ncbi:MAG: adenine deaminase [Aureispira sp.]|nr:adenine deaminase [Aureispira sp.]